LISGNITSNEGSEISERGFFYGTNQTPDISGQKIQCGSGTGTYSANLASLSSNTEYHIKAYAVNGFGTSYGEEILFKTDPSTVSDIDGNIYKVIRIGSQLWIQENLKTTRFLNGDFIPNVTDGNSWTALTTGAYCWYNNDIKNKDIYGALYNNYITKDPRGVCPAGWHIPNDVEWKLMENYLGGSAVAGCKLKATTLWDPPNTCATNESGFTAVPGGWRSNGIFHYMGWDATWWLIPAPTGGTDLFVSMGYSEAGTSSGSGLGQNIGWALRCIKN
jgi:uncharacterized protein (TIGR02145 family)